MTGDVRLTDAERAVMARPGAPVEESCEQILADRLAAERERIAQVEALHLRTHWCFSDDEQAEVYELGVLWPCPTLTALDGPA